MDKQTIEIKREDMPKDRDFGVLACIARKKGAHQDRKKQAAKKACRGKIKEQD